MTDGLAQLDREIARSPYLSWLGLAAQALAKGSVEARATWREEWIADPEIGQVQGGILAALVDFASSYALFVDLGRPAITVDLRVDFHRLALRGDLVARGAVVKHGRQISICEGQVLGPDGKVVASGRGTFLSATGA